ncbi:MAG: hypothetical protein KF768_02365 [Phycisphaeraceae bacterium]|nr:hypothetical protein [Phycisphaeraceae bacterium]
MAGRASVLACVTGMCLAGGVIAQPGGGGDVTIPSAEPGKSAPTRDRDGRERTTPERSRAGSEEIDLRPKFVQGRTTKYEFTMEHEISTGPAGSGQRGGGGDERTTSNLRQRMKISLHTVDAGETSSLMELTIEAFGLAIETDDLKLQASSDGQGMGGGGDKPMSDEDRMVSQMLEGVVKSVAGTKLRMTVDERGNITDIRGGDALSMTGLIAQIAGGLEGAGVFGGGLGGLVGGLLPGGGAGGASGMQWLISGASGQPMKARVGQTWTNVDKLGSTPIGDLQMVTKHTVRSIRGDLAEIGFDGQLEPTSQGGTGGTGGASPARVSRSGYKGSYTWDARAGELGRMSGEMRSELEAGGAEGTESRSVTRMSAERLGAEGRK